MVMILQHPKPWLEDITRWTTSWDMICEEVSNLPHKSYPKMSSIMLLLLAKVLGVEDVEHAMAMYNSCTGRTVLTMECIGVEAHETLVTAGAIYMLDLFGWRQSR